jgi:hypothetical protein
VRHSKGWRIFLLLKVLTGLEICLKSCIFAVGHPGGRLWTVMALHEYEYVKVMLKFGKRLHISIFICIFRSEIKDSKL